MNRLKELEIELEAYRIAADRHLREDLLQQFQETVADEYAKMIDDE